MVPPLPAAPDFVPDQTTPFKAFIASDEDQLFSPATT